jgi:mRNA interferase MazF
MPRQPERGEVWMVDLGMAQKTRPVLILSIGYSGEDRALVTVVSHTTTLRGSEFEVSVPVPFLKPGAFMVQSITTIPAKWALHRLGQLTPERLAPVEEGVRRWLAL